VQETWQKTHPGSSIRRTSSLPSTRWPRNRPPAPARRHLGVSEEGSRSDRRGLRRGPDRLACAMPREREGVRRSKPIWRNLVRHAADGVEDGAKLVLTLKRGPSTARVRIPDLRGRARAPLMRSAPGATQRERAQSRSFRGPVHSLR